MSTVKRAPRVIDRRGAAALTAVAACAFGGMFLVPLVANPLWQRVLAAVWFIASAGSGVWILVGAARRFGCPDCGGPLGPILPTDGRRGEGGRADGEPRSLASMALQARRVQPAAGPCVAWPLVRRSSAARSRRAPGPGRPGRWDREPPCGRRVECRFHRVDRPGAGVSPGGWMSGRVVRPLTCDGRCCPEGLAAESQICRIVGGTWRTRAMRSDGLSGRAAPPTPAAPPAPPGAHDSRRGDR